MTVRFISISLIFLKILTLAPSFTAGSSKTDSSDHAEPYYFATYVKHDEDEDWSLEELYDSSLYLFATKSFDFQPASDLDDQTDEQLLTDFLLRNYSADVRPVQFANQSLSVVARIYLIKILDLVEKEQVLHLVLRFQLGWRDLSLTWDPAEFGNLTSIILPGDTLWIPDIQNGNSANDRYGLLRNRLYPFKIHSDGEVWWHPTGSIFTRCSLDLTWFPFDVQRCPLVLESAMHSQSAVNLTVRPGKPAVLLSMYTENSLWDLKEADGTSYYYKSSSAASAKINQGNNQIKHENNYTRVVFWLKLQRKTTYYKLNVLYPCFMLTTMQLLTFLLPLNSLTRVPQATTILLSVIIFQAVIVDELPKTSDSKSLLSIYTMLMIAVSVVAIVESVFVANLLRRNFGPITLPRHTAFMLRVFLKSPPKKDDDSSGTASPQSKVLPRTPLPSRNLESVREENEVEQPSQNEYGSETAPNSAFLNVPSSSATDSGSGTRHRQSGTSHRGSIFNFSSPRGSSAGEGPSLYGTTNPEQVEHIRSHLALLWRRATGHPPAETVVVNWQRIAVLINTTILLICVFLVVIIPGCLMFAIPDE